MRPEVNMPGRFFGLQVLLLFCCVLFAGQTQAAAQDARELVQDGNKEFFEGNYTTAETRYRRAGQVDSSATSPVVPFNLGGALFRQERFAESIEQFDEVIAHVDATEEQRAAAWYNHGNAHLGMEDYAKAIDSYKQALRLNPADQDAKHNLAWAQKKLREQQQDQENQDQNGEDQENQDQNGEDQENQDQNGEDQENQDQNGEDQENQDQNGEDQENQDQNGEDQQNQDGQNQDGQNQDGQNQDGQNQDGQNQDGQNQDGQNQDGEDGEQQSQSGENGEDGEDGEQQSQSGENGEDGEDGEQQQPQNGENGENGQEGQQNGQSGAQGGDDQTEQDGSQSQDRVITISREDALRMLQALQNQEKNLQKKMRRSKGKSRKAEKDW